MWFGFGISAFLTFHCFQTLIAPYHAEEEEEEDGTGEDKTTPKKKGESGREGEPVSNVEENA
jgi:hypothetical protein